MTTARGRAKASRREALLTAAARLFAERGYPGTSIEELGAAAGVSGPALYKHFSGKQAMLAAILLEASEGLHSGGRDVLSRATGADALRALVAFHVEFALDNADVIRVQDRDLGQLAEDDRHTVRTLQRLYVEAWVEVLAGLNPDADRAVLRTRAHAVFGLLNSTPHSGLDLDRATLRRELERMALAALA
ncbi:AcrR family transcriptional regulator [Cryobacterium mesophilum]|uniref:TetR/AcrR family transcriptional regulator n=1 Tax=Terrimesophilobacter mesophilus TaxID=433647 RepID=A0A4V3I9D2_9MICO|nr:TetR/AcrR family transcriptional regulator [Terrimesophilobacter mesophilus]MBB5632175.1 AcrR family transcriptional regulator [Terrimesophilobacter mesophilus]TFB79038.1 TetR/AcrR family transcriptional regulator [Terrimesophilobacter mesophilus]